jgi:RND family efflux transporter MFP subunit
VSSALAKIEKTIIYAPIGGIVTAQDAKEGEIVTAQATVISIISEAEFEIETNITEIDISKIEIGDKASVTLDAYGDDGGFEAVVIFIDPAEKIIEGVSTYKTTLQFMDGNDKIKSGMSADLDILTNEKNNIIAIPQRAVITKNGNKIVRILQNKEVVEVEVKIGIRGSDGRIEIIQGLKDGDEVITFME